MQTRRLLTELLSMNDFNAMKECIAIHLRDISPISQIDIVDDDSIDISFLERSKQKIDYNRKYTAEEFFKEIFDVTSITRTHDQTYEVKSINVTHSNCSSSSSELVSHNGLIGRAITYSIVLSHNTVLYHDSCGYFNVKQYYHSTCYISGSDKQSYEMHYPLLSSDSTKKSIRASLYFIMQGIEMISENDLVSKIKAYPFEIPFEFDRDIRDIIREMNDVFEIEVDGDGMIWYKYIY